MREGEGADFALGVALGWVFHDGWVLFGDANYSQNPTPEFCDYTPNCRWSTPKAQVLTARVGVERRFLREGKKSHWAAAAAIGWIDLELHRIQFHSGSISLSLAHRYRVGPGALRLEARIDQGLDRRTDPDLYLVLDKARMRQYSLLFGYDWSVFDVDDLKRWKGTRWLFGGSSD